MHIKFLAEDKSGARLLEILVPKILGACDEPHEWGIHGFEGIGKLPKNLAAKTDPKKRQLLNLLPGHLRGFGKTPGIDAVVIVLDADKRNCREFLSELRALAAKCNAPPATLFRLAIEEIEAWYLGDLEAVYAAYPKTRNKSQKVLCGYDQDSICGTWELLANLLFPGGYEAIRKKGWPLPGQVKHEWAEKIGPHLDPDRNTSPSFGKFRDGLRRLAREQNGG